MDARHCEKTKGAVLGSTVRKSGVTGKSVVGWVDSSGCTEQMNKKCISSGMNIDYNIST